MAEDDNKRRVGRADSGIDQDGLALYFARREAELAKQKVPSVFSGCEDCKNSPSNKGYCQDHTFGDTGTYCPHAGFKPTKSALKRVGWV